MMLWKILMAFALTCAAAGQDLAPELVLLGRIKAHLREEFSHLPNYTCLETVTRFQRQSTSSHSKGNAKLQPLDTARLEVVYSDGREWYASPGNPTFRDIDPGAFFGSG